MSETAAAPSGAAPRLPEQARRAIDALRSRYPTEEALLLPALHIAQQHWDGWLPDEAIQAVAAELNLPPARVMGVVSFYDLFHQTPVGRHRIRVCTNLSCALRGAKEIARAVGEELGVDANEVSADGRASYTGFECLGACDMAPMMMVDDAYHGPLTPEQARRLVRELK